MKQALCRADIACTGQEVGEMTEFCGAVANAIIQPLIRSRR